MNLQIIDAKPHHCGQIARSIRVDHHAALLKVNVPIHHELRAAFDRSYYRRAAFFDGHLAAVWGAEGSILASRSLVWLALAQYAVKFPIAVLRQAKREIDYLARTKSELVTTVIPDDEAAQRLVAFLGFESPDGFGGGPARTRSSRGNLVRYLKSNPSLIMVTAGSARQVGVIWRRSWHGGA